MARVIPIDKIRIKGGPKQFKCGPGLTGFPRLYTSLVRLQLAAARLSKRADFDTAVRASNLATDLGTILRKYAP